MKIEMDTVKGFRDYLPPESLQRKKLREIIVTWFERFGFLPFETPIIEYDDLMKGDTTDGEDEAISDRFRLSDRGNRQLGLRYEFTFQLKRIFKQNPTIKLPLRRYQMGSNFRDEPIRTGRTREFTQCDVDVIGDASANAEAECVAVMAEILKEIGVQNYTIQMNNRKLLQAIIESVQITNVKQVMRELDKLEKVGKDEVQRALREYAEPNQIITLFRLLERNLQFFIENAFAGADEIDEFMETMQFYGIDVVFNPAMTRGFSYYTGNVFEFLTEKKVAVMGGGRYDESILGVGGRELPAVGLSFSLEALMGLFPEEIAQLSVDAIPQVLLISISQEKPTIALAQKLRKKTISCSMSFDKPGKALEYANAYSIPYVVFVGEEEVGKKKYKLKNMQTGKEQLLSDAGLIKKLTK